VQKVHANTKKGHSERQDEWKVNLIRQATGCDPLCEQRICASNKSKIKSSEHHHHMNFAVNEALLKQQNQTLKNGLVAFTTPKQETRRNFL
jgi:hypothetical protein